MPFVCPIRLNLHYLADAGLSILLPPRSPAMPAWISKKVRAGPVGRRGLDAAMLPRNVVYRPAVHMTAAPPSTR